MSLAILLVLFSADPVAVEPEKIDRSHVGQTIVVEDRIKSVLGSANRRQVRLHRRSEIPFRLKEVSPRELTGNAQLVGTVKMEAGQLVVDVDSVTLLPSDLDQFATRSAKIKEEDAAGWYALADWAGERYRLYGDGEIHAQMIAALQNGLAAERRAAGTDPAKLQALRDRSEKLPEAARFERAELDHAILRAEFAPLKPTDPSALNVFADRVAALRGKGAPAAHLVSEEFWDPYESAPVEIYRSASAADRNDLLRTWEVTLRRRAIELRVEQGNLTYEQAADEAAKYLPELPDVERAWIEKSIQESLTNLVDLSQRQVERLSLTIQDRLKDEPRALQVRRAWLLARDERMRQSEQGRGERERDAGSRFDLAQIALAWFPDDEEMKAKCGTWLTEALAIEPNHEPAAELLKQLGYHRTSAGTWETESDVTRERAGAAPRSLSIGLEESTVQSLLGKPDRQARIITGKRQVQNQWIYRDGSGVLVVNFHSDGSGKFRVSSLRRFERSLASAPNQVE